MTFGPDDRFGPNRLTYEEAHVAEWNRIHPGRIPPPIGNMRGGTRKINTEIPASQVSQPKRQRYHRRLRRNSPNEEGTTVAPRKTAAVEEPEETEELDLTVYKDKEITPTAQAFTEWIEDETGYEPDERSVYLAMSLRRKFQHDAATRTRIAELREERKPAKAAAEPEEKAPAAKRGAAKGVTSTSTTAKAPARGRAAAAKADAAKPTPPARSRSRKPAAAAAGAEAPF